MPDDPRRYELKVIRIGSRRGSRWAVAWLGAGVLVVVTGLAGALLAPPARPPTLAEVATSADPGGTSASASPSLPPLIIESTDFHANGGGAYYGIGGKLLRALGPTPAPTED